MARYSDWSELPESPYAKGKKIDYYTVTDNGRTIYFTVYLEAVEYCHKHGISHYLSNWLDEFGYPQTTTYQVTPESKEWTMPTRAQTCATFQIEYELMHSAIVDILANGLNRGYCAFDDVGFDEKQYKAAEESLLNEGWENQDICIEDVEARMLRDGGKIMLHELESGEDGWKALTLAKLIEGLRKYALNPHHGGLYDVLNCDPDCKLDAEDYDAILQYAVFGDWIIG